MCLDYHSVIVLHPDIFAWFQNHYASNKTSSPVERLHHQCPLASHAYNNLERLREIILLERFYESLSDDLHVLLVDKDPQTFVESAKLADTYTKTTPLIQKTSITTITPKAAYHSKSELLIMLMLAIKTRHLTRCLVEVNINRGKYKTQNTFPAIIQLFVSRVIKQTTAKKLYF